LDAKKETFDRQQDEIELGEIGADMIEEYMQKAPVRKNNISHERSKLLLIKDQLELAQDQYLNDREMAKLADDRHQLEMLDANGNYDSDETSEYDS